MAAIALAQEKVWFNKAIYDKAACLHFERIAKVGLVLRQDHLTLYCLFLFLFIVTK